jgi:hypothetical protein
VILGADDFDADTAERYGWINRAIPDSELDDVVAGFVRRILSFDSSRWRRARAILNQAGLPDQDRLVETQGTFSKTLQWPDALARLAKSRELGLGAAGARARARARPARRRALRTDHQTGINGQWRETHERHDDDDPLAAHA